MCKNTLGFFHLTYVDSKHQNDEHNQTCGFSMLDLDVLSMSAPSHMV